MRPPGADGCEYWQWRPRTVKDPQYDMMAELRNTSPTISDMLAEICSAVSSHLVDSSPNAAVSFTARCSLSFERST